MPEMWDPCQEELRTRNRNNPRDRRVLQSTTLKGVGELKSSDIRRGDAEFGVCLAGLQSLLSSQCSLPPFGAGDVYSVSLYVGNM